MSGVRECRWHNDTPACHAQNLQLIPIQLGAAQCLRFLLSHSPVLACACVCVLVSIGRHSDSLDTMLMRCGRCQGVLVRLGRFNPDGTPAKERAPTAFALFVQRQYSSTKAANPHTPHRDIMKMLSSGYKEAKGVGAAVSIHGADDEHQSVSAAQAELEAQMTALSVAEEAADEAEDEDADL